MSKGCRHRLSTTLVQRRSDTSSVQKQLLLPTTQKEAASFSPMPRPAKTGCRSVRAKQTARREGKSTSFKNNLSLLFFQLSLFSSQLLWRMRGFQWHQIQILSPRKISWLLKPRSEAVSLLYTSCIYLFNLSCCLLLLLSFLTLQKKSFHRVPHHSLRIEKLSKIIETTDEYPLRWIHNFLLNWS